MNAPQDSAGRPITVGDRVNWRGQAYTIKAFHERAGLYVRAIEFEEALHLDEVPDELAVDLVQSVSKSGGLASDGTKKPSKSCTDLTPSWFTGHWRDWHRGHGCDVDDHRPRSEDAREEIEQHTAFEAASSTFLTDAELRFLRASTTSGDELLVRALDELAARRTVQKARY